MCFRVKFHHVTVWYVSRWDSVASHPLARSGVFQEALHGSHRVCAVVCRATGPPCTWRSSLSRPCLFSTKCLLRPGSRFVLQFVVARLGRPCVCDVTERSRSVERIKSIVTGGRLLLRRKSPSSNLSTSFFKDATGSCPGGVWYSSPPFEQGVLTRLSLLDSQMPTCPS